MTPPEYDEIECPPPWRGARAERSICQNERLLAPRWGARRFAMQPGVSFADSLITRLMSGTPLGCEPFLYSLEDVERPGVLLTHIQ